MSAKLMIWRKNNIFLLYLSLFFSFFLIQCYSQHNKTYIKIFQFNLTPHYYVVPSIKLMIWRKENILILYLSLLFSLFLLQCYSQYDKTYIKTFQFNLTHHYYAITYAKLLIWRKENILLLCLSLLFSFFFLQCYSQHNKSYIKTF